MNLSFSHLCCRAGSPGLGRIYSPVQPVPCWDCSGLGSCRNTNTPRIPLDPRGSLAPAETPNPGIRGAPTGPWGWQQPSTDFRGHFHGLYSPGEPMCDLEPGTFRAADPNILERLKLCPALTGAQRDALNALLLSGDTAYG